jgi:DNA methylase
VAGRTQAALYEEINLELSWSEAELPQAERTKHVHSLHPYLGKFVPQLVEYFLRRYFSSGDCVYDPFVGSGTTLVEANTFGAHAIGCDISAFNCLITRVKTQAHAPASLEMELRRILEDAQQRPDRDLSSASEWLANWYSPRALSELLRYRDAASEADSEVQDVANLILCRSARSARLTTHFDLDFPRRPAREPYYCHKHKRTCRPVDEADKFLRRYSADTASRIREFAAVRQATNVDVLHDDSRTVELPTRPNGVITSPPYPGLIDYHEQHRYAYELLGLTDRRTAEIGPAVRGTSRLAVDQYVEDMSSVLRHTGASMAAESPVVIVVNDSRSLYPSILERAGLVLEERITRHVNRRTGRRAGEFFESVLVCRTG